MWRKRTQGGEAEESDVEASKDSGELHFSDFERVGEEKSVDEGEVGKEPLWIADSSPLQQPSFYTRQSPGRLTVVTPRPTPVQSLAPSPSAAPPSWPSRHRTRAERATDAPSRPRSFSPSITNLARPTRAPGSDRCPWERVGSADLDRGRHVARDRVALAAARRIRARVSQTGRREARG